MTRLDLTPLFRSTVGFDRLSRLMDSALDFENAPSYPPYNIEKISDNRYRITMAVAGFAEEDLDVVKEENTLTVRGRVVESGSANEDSEFLHRGIAGRAFERHFQLADHIEVRGAEMERGLLHIYLEREVPEAKRPQHIEIGSKAVKGWLSKGKAA